MKVYHAIANFVWPDRFSDPRPGPPVTACRRRILSHPGSHPSMYLLLLLSLACAGAPRTVPAPLAQPQERPAPGARPAQPPATGARPAANPADELAPQIEPDTLPQLTGAWGIVLPTVQDARSADLLVHEDASGRAQKQLLDLAGSAEHGFAAVWRDLRDGHAGLYFGRVGRAGEALEAERALYPTGSASREIEPAIALSSHGHGAFVWHTSNLPPHPLRLRVFDAKGVLDPQFQLLSDLPEEGSSAGRPTALGAQGGGGRGGGGVRLPAIAITDTWGAVAWGDAGTLWVERFDPSGAKLGSARAISSAERPLSGPLRLRASAAAPQRLGCAWTTRQGVEFREIGESDGPSRLLGPGVLVRLVAAPGAAGGWWALVQTPAGHRVLGVPASAGAGGAGELITLDPGIPARESCDLAARSSDLLLCVQRANGVVEILRLDPRAATSQWTPLAVLDSGGSAVADLRIEAAGDRALLAWTGIQGSQRDIWMRTLDAESKFGPLRLWNSDVASSPQTNPRIASRGGDEAAIVWVDGRTGENQLLARVIGADGKFRSGEIPITLRPGTGGAPATALPGLPTDPSIAMASGGAILVGWKQLEQRGFRLLGQVLDEQGAAQSPLLEFAAGEEAPPVFKADLALAPFGRGFALAYGVKDRGVFVRSVLANGRGLSEPLQVGEHPVCQNVSLAPLDGGGMVVAWDISVPGAPNKAVRARVLDAQLQPQGDEIEPPLTLFGDDWDPSVAACNGGGFAVVFTGGQAHSRDVMLRFFDAKGALASPLVPISTRMMEQDFARIVRLSDGTLCVAWEDDLSAYDHTYVRRVSRARGEAATVLRGPSLTLNQREAVLNENRGAPDLAPLAGGGFAAVWVDCSRSLGTDVRVKILGPKFDDGGR